MDWKWSSQDAGASGQGVDLLLYSGAPRGCLSKKIRTTVRKVHRIPSVLIVLGGRCLFGYPKWTRQGMKLGLGVYFNLPGGECEAVRLYESTQEEYGMSVEKRGLLTHTFTLPLENGTGP